MARCYTLSAASAYQERKAEVVELEVGVLHNLREEVRLVDVASAEARNEERGQGEGEAEKAAAALLVALAVEARVAGRGRAEGQVAAALALGGGAQDARQVGDVVVGQILEQGEDLLKDLGVRGAAFVLAVAALGRVGGGGAEVRRWPGALPLPPLLPGLRRRGR